MLQGGAQGAAAAAESAPSDGGARRDPFLWLVLALAVAAALPALVGPGIVATRAGGDSPFLVQRVHQLSAVLRAGTFPARWMPDAAHGLGYPFFHYYAALPYYLAAVLNLAGAGVLWGIKLVQALGFVLAALATYRLAREMGAAPPGALLAAAAYTFAPFHLVNVYVRGDSLSEFWAMALFPTILWALARLSQRPSPGRVAALAASYGLLALCHNISAVLFSPLVAACLMAAAWSKRRNGGGRLLLAGGAALALGLLVSAWFWAPALRDQPLVQLQEQTTGYFHYAGHFRAADLVQWRAVHDYAITGERDPFSAGLIQVLVALPGLAVLGLALVRRRGIGLASVVAVLAAVAYSWLITPSSAWLWGHLPLLRYAQFPWRLLSVQALALALIASYAPRAVPRRGQTTVALLLAAAVAVAGMAGLSVDRLPLHEADITPERLMLYETYSGNVGTTVRHEYLPQTMVPRPYTSARQLAGDAFPPLALSGAIRSAWLIERGPVTQTWDLDLEGPSLLAFHLAAFPGWEATVDGVRQPVESLYGLGLVGLRLEGGRHEVHLAFAATRFWRVVECASAAGLVALLGLALYPCRASRAARRRALRAAGIVALLAIWLVVAPQRQAADPQEGPLVADWDRAPYLHREPEGVRFGDLVLQECDDGAMLPVPGGTVPVTLTWKGAAHGERVRLELVAATAHLFEPAPIWATTEATLTLPSTSLALPLPQDLPDGLYVLRLTVLSREGEVTPRTAGGIGMGRLVLEPMHVESPCSAAGNEAVLGWFGPPDEPPVIALVGADAQQAGDGLAEVTLQWRSERQAPLNYYLSLRVLDAGGAQVASRDLPPLLGGYPTSLWRPGRLISDRVLVPLPAEAPPAEALTLEVVLYDRITLSAVGTARVPPE